MIERKKYKKFVICVMCLTFFSCFFSCFLNLIVDPLNVFRLVSFPKFNLIKVCETKQERISKIPQMKTDKSKVSDIFVGSSKIGWVLDKDYLNFLSNENGKIQMHSINSAILQENIITIKNMKFLHPELKKAYLGIDFHSFGKPIHFENEAYKLIDSNHLTFEELKPLLLSLKVFEYSLTTISKNMKVKNFPPTQFLKEKTQTYEREYHLIGGEVFEKFEETIKSFHNELYKNYELNEQNFEDIKELNEYAKNNNIEIVYFTTPSHISDLVNIYTSGKWEEFKKFKRELAKICDYYDFMTVNEYNTENITSDIKYFRDSIHASGYSGRILVDKLYGISEDWDLLITKDNVEEELNKTEQLLSEYINSHPDIVNKVKEWQK